MTPPTPTPPEGAARDPAGSPTASPAEDPTESPGAEGHLGSIEAAAAGVQEAEQHLTQVVLAARADGLTWQQIGRVLGVSRQAAFKRFGKPIDPDTGVALTTGPVVDPARLAESVFRHIAAGDYDDLRDLMTHACSRELTRPRVMGVWRDVLASVGQLEGFSGHESRDRDGDRLPGGETTGPLVARVLLRHEAGEMAGHVSINRAGRVDGILLAPPSAEDSMPF